MYEASGPTTLPSPTLEKREAPSTTTGVRSRILLAEDDAEMRSLLVEALCDGGHEVMAVENGVELSRRLEYLPSDATSDRVAFDLIVSDVRMPGASGLDVAVLARVRWPQVPILLITAFGDEDVYERAARLGLAEVLDKPFGLDDFLGRVQAALDRRQRDAASPPRGQEDRGAGI